MSRTSVCGLFLLCGAFLFAADNPSVPAWKTRPLNQWTKEDAREILTESPWVGHATLQPIPDRSPGERRDSGDWDAGAGHGVGIAGTGILGPTAMREAIARAHDKPSPGTIVVRWESALPIRTAEAKFGDSPATASYNGWYAITLYDVPVPKHWGAVKLRRLAFLKRDNKPDLRPSRVEIVPEPDEEGMATVTYLFSRNQEISRRDRTVTFEAQIDRLFVSEYFYPPTMTIAGQLEL
jgi:hypothetical protein